MTDPSKIAAIISGLSEAQKAFLIRVCDDLPLGLADREEDRARQAARRLGLVRVVKKPRRWIALPLGELVRAELMKEAGE